MLEYNFGCHQHAGLLVGGGPEAGDHLHLVVVGVVPPHHVAPLPAPLAVTAALSS